MSSFFRSIGSYFGFLTSAPPTTVVTTGENGEVVTSVQAAPTSYVSPDVVEVYELMGQVTFGSTTGLPQFVDFPLRNITFNPPLTSFSVSKIRSVKIRAPALPHDANWYAGIWSQLTATGRDYTAVALRAPNVMWVWRSNLTVMQPIEFTVPWPVGRPVSDSLHATLPGLHLPSLQIALHNAPPGTASALPNAAYVFNVVVEVEVAGRGMFGTI